MISIIKHNPHKNKSIRLVKKKTFDRLEGCLKDVLELLGVLRGGGESVLDNFSLNYFNQLLHIYHQQSNK